MEDVGGDYWRSFTHFNKNKGASLVDLAISSCNLFDKIKAFSVSPQSELSDHCKITLSFGSDNHTQANEQKTDEYKWFQLPNRYKWDPKMSSKCKEVLSSTFFKGIVEQATQTLEAGLIESTGLKIQQIFQETAKECLRKSNSTHTKQKIIKPNQERNGLTLIV